jgi:hypothetical protein
MTDQNNTKVIMNHNGTQSYQFQFYCQLNSARVGVSGGSAEVADVRSMYQAAALLCCSADRWTSLHWADPKRDSCSWPWCVPALCRGEPRQLQGQCLMTPLTHFLCQSLRLKQLGKWRTLFRPNIKPPKHFLRKSSESLDYLVIICIAKLLTV